MKITTLTKNQLPLLFSFIKLEGWNLEEIHMCALYKTNPNDFFIAFKDENVVGFILAIKHTHAFGVISTFLLLKEFRSLGLGKIIFQHALQHLDGFQIALDSVCGYEKFYEQFGFRAYFDVYTYRYVTNDLRVKNQTTKVFDFNKKSSLKNKNKYQKSILKNKNVKYKEIQKSNQVSSFSYMFKYSDGYKITIESDDINESISLFLALTKELSIGESIYMEASKLSPLLLDITKVLEMKISSKFTRMYNKILT